MEPKIVWQCTPEMRADAFHEALTAYLSENTCRNLGELIERAAEALTLPKKVKDAGGRPVRLQAVAELLQTHLRLQNHPETLRRVEWFLADAVRLTGWYLVDNTVEEEYLSNRWEAIGQAIGDN